MLSNVNASTTTFNIVDDVGIVNVVDADVVMNDVIFEQHETKLALVFIFWVLGPIHFNSLIVNLQAARVSIESDLFVC